MFKNLFYALLAAFAVFVPSAFAGQSPDGFWEDTDPAALSARPAERNVVPDQFRTVRLNQESLRSFLKTAPMEFTDAARAGEVILTLPMPDGTFERFRIEKSPIVEPALSAKFPELAETFRGQGIDDPTASLRFDLLPSGFHSMILSSRGTVMIDPYFAKGDTENYIVYKKSDVAPTANFICDFKSKKSLREILSPEELLSPDFISKRTDEVISGTQLRTYRLAVAATNEYAVAVGTNTVSGTLAAQVLIMNRVNGVYERDVAIRMVMVGNNNLIVYAANNTCGGVPCTAANDPFTNNDGGLMLDENQATIDSVIGAANYDIGHVFSTGGGGVAYLEVPCEAGFKAGGVTGLSNPVGDPFAIDYVAHEMGHQWGADHTFNTTAGSCGGGNRAPSEAFEPGSGITIMAYAGICGSQNLGRNSIDTFHIISLERIVAYSQTGLGNSCATTTSTGNTPPAVSVVGGPTFNIPKQTPFALTATSSDTNGDTITYDWQEYDLGASTTAAPNTDATGGARPIFRPYLPSASGTRYFPSLQYILANANVPPTTFSCSSSTCLTGELLPAITRSMQFRVVARDNRANGGGINSANATVSVDASSGPFLVTAPNTAVTVSGNSSQTITWNVTNTTAAPVSAANVKISLSTDGGQTFPTVLLASTPNDGSQSVTVPNVATSTARIKVEAVGNIFFDISDANFTITPSEPSARRFIDFDGDGKTDISIFRPGAGEWWYLRSTDGGNSALQFGSSTDILAPADFTGDGKTDITFWRPSTGEWFILRSENLTFLSFPFGSNNDIPTPGDFDGDGKADPAVYRPSTGTWFISRSSDNGTTITSFGLPTDKPVAADYDGDGKDDVAIYRPAASEWWILRSTLGLTAFQFGATGDKTVQGDYTGDGKADVAVFRPTNGFWYILRSEDSSFFAVPFGTTGDVPAPGDYDGDGKYDTTVFRPAGSTWFSNRSTAGTLITGFGTTGDNPVPGTYVR